MHAADQAASNAEKPRHDQYQEHIMNEGRCLPRCRDYDPILPYQELLDWNEVRACS